PIVSASGYTLNEALNVMNAGVERTINLSHLAAVMVSENVAREGMLPYLNTLTRYREFRRTLFLFITKGAISNIFLHDKPVLETSATRVIEDFQSTTKRTGLAPSMQVHQFLTEMETPNEDPVAPVLSVNERVAAQKKKTAGSANGLSRREIGDTPGGVNRSGGNPVEDVGTAVFRGDKMVDLLTGEQTRSLQLLSGSIKRLVLSVPSPIRKGGYVALAIRYAKPMHVSLTLRPHPVLSIKQSFEAELLGDESNGNFVPPANRRKLASAMSAMIHSREMLLMQRVFARDRADPFRFFRYARAQFPTNQALLAYDWHKQLPTVKIRLSVETNVRRLGTQLAPPSIP
ncbi:hypothetical protein AYW79_06790, partial [Ferroacidibacillus organovorans]